MSRWIEILLFSSAAILAHVALFAHVPEEGSDAGGVGGAALISLKAADAAVAEMVETWDRPPLVTSDVEPDLPQVPTETAAIADLPHIDLAEVPRAEMRMAVLSPALPEGLGVDREALRSPPPPLRAERPRPEDVPETARKAEQSSPGRAAQKAAGRGGQSQAGQAGRAEVATASKGEQARAQAIWGAKIRSRIERAKRYPRGGTASGQVRLAITISRDGQLLDVRLQGSSGHLVLDRAAIDAVRRARRFPVATRDLTRRSYRFSLVIILKR